MKTTKATRFQVLSHINGCNDALEGTRDSRDEAMKLADSVRKSCHSVYIRQIGPNGSQHEAERV